MVTLAQSLQMHDNNPFLLLDKAFPRFQPPQPFMPNPEFFTRYMTLFDRPLLHYNILPLFPLPIETSIHFQTYLIDSILLAHPEFSSLEVDLSADEETLLTRLKSFVNSKLYPPLTPTSNSRRVSDIANIIGSLLKCQEYETSIHDFFNEASEVIFELLKNILSFLSSLQSLK